ncbi:lytic polysaccharide monooxygenase [Isoptericola dokdonensis]|uniref:Endoglucanase E-2 n=1 Tax=Isoptericola dokdonensis DS-3 TaxID=1300344 RepID=A0A168EZV2_9MICO|nr:lytic polysaccharide monooxygenase [Isoptericola dokdonensis]ANC30711.1 Endoglucanase E-2 precursor [Isoptericola dokdonensis DS-3]
MSHLTRRQRAAMAAAAVLVAPLALAVAVTGGATTAAAHGSVTDPPTRNYGCWDRWADEFQNPDMAELDPQCWQAWQAEPAAMWNWNGLYREQVGGDHQGAIPEGQLCSGGQAEGGRYDALDDPGEWYATGVDHQFELTLTDQANHGADYLLVYVSKEGFDPTTEALGWDDVELVQETGSYPTQSPYVTDVDLTGRDGRAVLFTVWKASHADQNYYLCSDINIGGPDLVPGDGGVDPTDPPVEPTDPPVEPTDPPVEPTDPPVEPDAGCTAEVTVAGSWNGGYQATVTITAGDAAISGWEVDVAGATITQAWNGVRSGSTIANAAWNGSLAPGSSTTAGFLGSGEPSDLTAECTVA